MEGLVYEPLHRCLLLGLGNVCLGILLAAVLNQVGIFYTAEVGHHMGEVAHVLAKTSLVHLLDFLVVVVLDAEPLGYVGDNLLEVLDTIVVGLHVVVAEVFHLVGGVDGEEQLLGTELIHGVALLGLDDGVEILVLVFGSFGVLEETVAPVDGVYIVYADDWGNHAHTALEVAGLCHVVVAGVVHDTGRGAILLGERGAAQ